MSPRFAELLGRSCFSFLEGASHPEELVLRAKELELEAVALCDRRGLYGSVRAHQAGKEHAQRVIVGAELPLGGPAAPRLALLVETHAGYRRLCELLTQLHAPRANAKGAKADPEAVLPLEAILRDSAGLSAILPLDDAPEAAVSDPVLGALVEAFGDRASVAVHRHLVPGDAARVAAARAAERRYGGRVIATARPGFHHPSRRPLADVLHCIRHRTTLDQAGQALASNAEAYLRSAAQMSQLFPEHPAWIERTVEVADRCRFSLGELRYRFPSDELCQEGEGPNEALRRLTMEGCRLRYPEGTPPKVAAQIEHELCLIAKLDVAPYFLSVQQLVDMARARRILCQGRGSAANSAVCFVLGITAVDPARSNLLFERFLSAERAEPPDIDVDFEHERREEVIQAIYAHYGRDRAAMASAVISYRSKSALRDVGKALGLSLDQVDRLSHLPLREEDAVVEARLVELGLDPAERRVGLVVKLARELRGFPRHLSIHVGGFILSAEPLSNVAPVEPASMPGRTVIAWDKDDLDALGFFKVDVLALGMLTAIRKALATITELSPEAQVPADPILALASIEPEDARVYEAISRADTVGVFQIESRAQMSMLPRLRPRTFYDLVIEVALVRPGPIQGNMVHPYLRRRSGLEPATSPHPCLDSILSRTLGVPLFQEQVMEIAMKGAGYTPGEADQLRRDMAAWKRKGGLARHREKLLGGFRARGISEAFGEQLYSQIQGFAEYGFPESHAASFALLVYASAWLRVHHLAAFVAALLNSQPMGFYSTSSIIRDAQKHRVTVLPVCVARSGWDAILEPHDGGEGSASLTKTGPLRLGLREVRGLGEAAARSLVQARSERPFAAIDDLVRRGGLSSRDLDALAEAGALAALAPSRREALWRVRAPRLGGLFEGVALEPDVPAMLPPIRPMEQLILDYDRVGLSLTDHPMRHLRASLDERRVLTTGRLVQTPSGRMVRVAGLVIGRQRPATASGVTFMTLEDETSTANLIVRREVWERYRAAATHATMVLAVGKVERQGPVVHVIVEALTRLDRAGLRRLTIRSRDFH